jgi:DinB family protein
MQYMKLDPDQREEFLTKLADMPVYLREVLSRLSPERTMAPAADGTPSPVEQVWHLADLEREGFGDRIRRLLTENEPTLPDFDGANLAAQRNYRGLRLEDGLAAFAAARRQNLATLRAIEGQAWFLNGTQEGVGKVSLCDIPGFMAQHDGSHKAEIEKWIKSADR